MSRSVPPYQTPQSNSPSSQHSPQPHSYAPPSYGAHYQQSQGYGNFGQGHYSFPQHGYQQNFLPHYAYPPARPSMTPQVFDSPVVHTPQERQSSFSAATPVLASNQMSTPIAPPTRVASSSSTNTLPGPIKATVPIVVKKDADGVVWIRFDYTKDRVRKSYDIRCDVDRVDLNSLSEEFKKRNVVYPRAFKGERYTRHKYESECNETAWALVKLNPELDGHKGLRQRAVDSWRNSNLDGSKASRRVRRDAKKQIRNEQAQKQARKDDIRAAATYNEPTLPRLQYASAMSSASHYMPVSAGTTRHWSNGDMPAYPDSTSYDSTFMSPHGARGAVLPPTPDTMAGSKRGSSAGSNGYMDHGHGHGHYKGGPIAQLAVAADRRNEASHFHDPLPSSTHKHISPDASTTTDVYPRARSGVLGDCSPSDYNYTRTQVRVGEGFGFDKILTVPATSEVRARSDRAWNVRGHELSRDLARTGLGDFAGRPQALQQACKLWMTSADSYSDPRVSQ